MPEDVKDVFGNLLDEIQTGFHPVGARPFGEGLPSGVMKLVENHDGETYRCAKSHYEQNKSRYVARVASGHSTKRSPRKQGE